MRRFLEPTRKFIARYLTRHEEGATLAEYGLLLALIAGICVVAVTALGTSISSVFQNLTASI
jgi:pilus assembly protein Flp/PilA